MSTSWLSLIILSLASELVSFEVPGRAKRSYYDEDLENIADDDQSRYFIKTETISDRRPFYPTFLDRDQKHLSGQIQEPTSSTMASVPDPTSPANEERTTTELLHIPGIAGIDYPIYHEVPETGFSCQKQRYKGFFADMQTNCQAWHYCDFTDGRATFLCPNGTLFSQILLTCDWWFNVNCQETQQLYVLNERLYRYVKHPKPTFPEDFHGPEVDLWLKRQLQLGILPKRRRRLLKRKSEKRAIK